jgi:hypothetical protein
MVGGIQGDDLWTVDMRGMDSVIMKVHPKTTPKEEYLSLQN